MSELQKHQEIKRQPETEKSNFLEEIKKQLAALLAAIWIWVSGAVDNVGKVIIPSAYGAEVKKEIREDLKNIKVVEVKNMKEFEDYVVNKLDNTQNVAIIKINKDDFDQKYYKENIDNNFWNIKVLKIWEEGGYKYFLISGSKFKETNEGFRKVMVALDEESKKLDEESKKLDEESKKLDEKLSQKERILAYYKLENELYAIIIYVNMGKNVRLLKEYNWKFSKRKLEKINRELDKVQVLKIDDKTFKTLIYSLKQLERRYPDMKDLIEEIIKKLKLKERRSPSMYAYLKK